MARNFKTAEAKEEWEAEAAAQLIELEEAAKKKYEFYQMPVACGFRVVELRLSPTTYRLWIYLCCMFPFGDRQEYMPTQSELAARLGVSRQAILKAASELEEAGLWEFKVERWKGRNKTGHGWGKEVGSTKTNRGKKNITPGQENATPCNLGVTPGQENVTPCNLGVTPGQENVTLDIYIDRVRDQTIPDLDQTIPDLKQTLSNAPEREEREDVTVVTAELVLPEEILTSKTVYDTLNTSLSEKITRFNKDNDSGSRYNKSTLEKGQKIWEQYASGKITSIPRMELRLVAEYKLGADFCKAYRHSGDIGRVDQNDYKDDFVCFVAINHLTSHLKGDLNNAMQMIANIERSPDQWKKLQVMVEAWKQGKTRSQLSRELANIQRQSEINKSFVPTQPQTSSPTSDTEKPKNLKKEKLQVMSELNKVRSQLNAKLNTPYPEVYPAGLIEGLTDEVRSLERKLAALSAELEFGF